MDRDTHEARKAAHAAFDPIWKRGKMRRGDAYQFLADKLGLSMTDCHMKLMDAATAQRVPGIAQEILDGKP